MEVLNGCVEHIVFRNEENGYSVFHFSCDEHDDIICVGTVPLLKEGTCLEIQGTYVDHPVYGMQLKISTVEEKLPEDTVSIERYLGSGAIKGIGAKLAHSIVMAFQEDTFRIIEEEPERLAEIKGISLKKARDIGLQVDGKREYRRSMMFLQELGITGTMAVKIHERYGADMFTVIQENPYRLAEEITGIGFPTADHIAQCLKTPVSGVFRVRSGILHILNEASLEGHVFLPEEELLKRSGRLLGVTKEEIHYVLSDLNIERKIVIRTGTEEAISDNSPKRCINRVYLSNFFSLELNTARMLKDLNLSYSEDKDQIEKSIDSIEKKNEIQLDEMQRRAVSEAAGNGIMILTGGPGTGKTTTINSVIEFFESSGKEVLLAAPTGRAARRMSETTGREAQTIHRLLEVMVLDTKSEASKGGTGREKIIFSRNRENPLETDVVIIDEMSMVDIHLMHALLSALTPGTRLILVGDVNQLPSVGPGSVLRDMISSNVFHVVKLEKIFRQAAQSDIVLNAHRINEGKDPKLGNDSRDFFFLQRSDPDRIISNIITLVHEKMPKYVDAPEVEIQVMTPMRKGALGVERLNRILQQYLNPPDDNKPEKTLDRGIFRVGDKVMQIRNDYNLTWEIKGYKGITISQGEGVFNGDIGLVKTINTFQETLTVVFDENKEVEYPFSLLDELELAYAITIHKAQGSEYPAVVIPLLTGPTMLFNRNLLYTAVTRARKCVTLLGSEDTIRNMVRNTGEQRRWTSLDDRLREM